MHLRTSTPPAAAMAAGTRAPEVNGVGASPTPATPLDLEISTYRRCSSGMEGARERSTYEKGDSRFLLDALILLDASTLILCCRSTFNSVSRASSFVALAKFQIMFNVSSWSSAPFRTSAPLSDSAALLPVT
jgi:hypothetical protein